MQSSALAEFVADKLDDLKGRDITTIDISNKADFADYMVICSGNSNRHVKSLADNVVKQCKDEGLLALGIEGNDTGEWVLVDLGAVIVHVMLDEMRDRYQLEQLWADE